MSRKRATHTSTLTKIALFSCMRGVRKNVRIHRAGPNVLGCN